MRLKPFLLNFIFFLQVLLLFLLLVEDRIELPVVLQVLGRFHPAILHLPIGLLFFFVIVVLVQNEFKKKSFRRIALYILMFTSLTASITALFGFFLSRQGDYGGDALFQHKFSGTALSILCYVLLILFDRKGKTEIAFYGCGFVTIVLLFIAGHSGGTLTHGENFISGPIKSTERVDNINQTAFQQAVYPILERKCTSCHNPSKAKGKFVMTSIEEFKKGGKKGEEWKSGKPLESRLIQYIHLPLEDDDHMPPDGKPQLTIQEIKLLEQWVRSGGEFDKKLTDLREDDSLRILAAGMSHQNEAVVEKQYSFSSASEKIIQKMNTPFRAVFPLYMNSPALQADFFIKEKYSPNSLEELKEVKDQLVVLNLSKMPVKDEELKTIGSFTNLEKINLNFSEIKGPGFVDLQSLKNLTSVSLSGTKVTIESLKPILSLPALRELFVWSTGITNAQVASLNMQYPALSIVTSQFVDDKVLRLGKPLLENEGLIKKGELVSLKHSMPGVTLRYTLDGTPPDSLTSMFYDGPLNLTETSKIKAIVCKEGWYCSDVFEITCFMEGYKPVKTELLSKTVKYYSGQGSASLTDGGKGFVEVLNTPFWLGFREEPLVAGFDFGSDPPDVRSIVISFAKNLYSSGFPPTEVEVWGGTGTRDLKLIKSMKIDQPKAYISSQVEALSIPLLDAHYSYYKLVARPVEKLPQWHDGKGKKGLLLVDEVLFY